MATIFDNNFSGETPGTDPPSGWLENAALGGQVVNFGTMTGSTQAVGFYERLGRGYHMGINGDLVYENSACSAVTLVWAAWGNPGAFPNMKVGNLIGTALPNIQDIVGFFAEGDGSVSIRAVSTNGGFPIPGGYLAVNSQHQNTWNSTWHYFQFNVVTRTENLGTAGSFIGFDAKAFVDGIKVCEVSNFITNVNVGTAAGPPYINIIQIQGNGFTSDWFAADAIYTGYGTNSADVSIENYWPHPAYSTLGSGTMDAFVTQGVTEVAKKFTSPEARVTQGVVEIPWMPLSANRPARITQGVVEIIKRGAGVGWRVYEA